MENGEHFTIDKADEVGVGEETEHVDQQGVVDSNVEQVMPEVVDPETTDSDKGRHGLEKAAAIGWGIHESGWSGRIDDSLRDLKVGTRELRNFHNTDGVAEEVAEFKTDIVEVQERLNRAKESGDKRAVDAAQYTLDNIRYDNRAMLRKEMFMQEKLSEFKGDLDDDVKSADRSFAELYDLNPDKFAAMSTTEFVDKVEGLASKKDDVYFWNQATDYEMLYVTKIDLVLEEGYNPKINHLGERLSDYSNAMMHFDEGSKWDSALVYGRQELERIGERQFDLSPRQTLEEYKKVSENIRVKALGYRDASVKAVEDYKQQFLSGEPEQDTN